MSIFIKEIETTIKIDRQSAQMLVDALLSYANSLTKEKDGCKCSFCENPKTRASKILDIYFEAYPLSKVAKQVISIPSLKDIENKLSNKPTKDKINVN